MLNLLTEVYFLLKPTGYLILKEAVLFEEESAPRLCLSGQGMLVRPMRVLEKWLARNYHCLQSVHIPSEEDYDPQLMWLLQPKPLSLR